MQKENFWLLKLINPITDVTLTIYDNGMVYGKNKGEKLFILSKDAINIIKRYINQDAFYLKTNGPHIRQKKSGLITIINFKTRKYGKVTVYGWDHEDRIKEIIKNNIIKSFICN